MRIAWITCVCIAIASCGGPPPDDPSTHATSQQKKKTGKREGPYLHPSKVEDYLKLKGQLKYKEGLDLLRQETAHPVAPENDDYLVDLNGLAIAALADWASNDGFRPEYDLEMKRYFAAASKYLYPDDTERRARIAHIVGLYYSKTGRNGLGLPYFFDELELWQKVGNKFQTILAYDGLATTFWDSGKLEQSKVFSTKAFDLAAKYFRGPKDPADAAQWIQYLEMLDKEMDNVARTGGSTELDKSWAIMEPILKRGVTIASPYYLAAAGRYAIAGDTAKSKALWDKGAALAVPPGNKKLEREILSCGRAQVLTFQKAWTDAKEAWKICDEVTTEKHLTRETGTYRLRGMTFEGTGELDAALEQYKLYNDKVESSRSAFTVAQRVQFFRTISADGYYGSVRVLARKAEKAGDEASAFTALKASESIRARQFGEVLDERGRGSGALETIGQLRDRLGDNDALVDFIVMPSDIAAFAVTKTQVIARTIPIDETFGPKVRRIARALSSPSGGNPDQALGEIGDLILGPLRSTLAGKTRFIVLPDGILNAIPFDLLRVGGNRLVDSTTVEITPSISYFIRKNDAASATKGIFGVADPTYPRKIRVGAKTLEAKDFGGKLHDPPFPALPETRSEMDAVAALFKGEPADTLLGGQALESSLKKASLQQYRFLHFATHGVLGNQIPTLDEPALVLADETGEDALLTATEAEKLKLNAELTVLSACNTGSGEYVGGEGVLGMSRAFLIAGSRSVLVSLWSVDSLATELLMVDFYKRLRGGADAASALRAAKLAIRSATPNKTSDSRGLVLEEHVKEAGGSMQHPYFWSAFMLVGK